MNKRQDLSRCLNLFDDYLETFFWETQNQLDKFGLIVDMTQYLHFSQHPRGKGGLNESDFILLNKKNNFLEFFFNKNFLMLDCFNMVDSYIKENKTVLDKRTLLRKVHFFNDDTYIINAFSGDLNLKTILNLDHKTSGTQNKFDDIFSRIQKDGLQFEIFRSRNGKLRKQFEKSLNFDETLHFAVNTLKSKLLENLNRNEYVEFYIKELSNKKIIDHETSCEELKLFLNQASIQNFKKLDFLDFSELILKTSIAAPLPNLFPSRKKQFLNNYERIKNGETLDISPEFEYNFV